MNQPTPNTIPLGHVPIRDIVQQTLIDSGDMNSQEQYARRLSWALMCLRLLGYNSRVFPEKVYEIRGSQTDLIDPTTISAPLPADYNMWIGVGYVVNGKLVRMTYNPQHVAYQPKDACGDNEQYPLPYNPTYGSYWYGLYGTYPSGYGGGDFGVNGGSTLSRFSIDTAGRRIHFDSSLLINYPIVMEYLTNGMEEEGRLHYIDSRCEDAVRAYIHWQSVRFKASASIGERQEAERLYVEARKTAKYNIYAISNHQVADYIRQNMRTSIKM